MIANEIKRISNNYRHPALNLKPLCCTLAAQRLGLAMLEFGLEVCELEAPTLSLLPSFKQFTGISPDSLSSSFSQL